VFTAIALDPREIDARREALSWLSHQMRWERVLGRLRDRRLHPSRTDVEVERQAA
jgi:hypothetical protein